MRLSLKLLISLLFVQMACTTTAPREQPTAYYHPASYSADGFMVDNPAPVHEESPKDQIFYHTKCSLTSPQSFYSQTSYYCDDLNQ